MIISGIVAANTRLCREHLCLTVRVAEFPTVVPGQFVHFIPEGNHSDSRSHTWPENAWPAIPPRGLDCTLTYRRAFSIARARQCATHVELDLIYRVVGRCTTWMGGMRPGDHANILGPVGRGFVIAPEIHTALLVAGGVGLPAVLMLATTLASHGIDTILFCGAQTHDLVPLRIATPEALSTNATVALHSGTELSEAGVGLIISTDDGSLGFHGYIPAALTAYVNAQRIDARTTTVFTCGPEIMMRSVADHCATWGYACQVCMERPMAYANGRVNRACYPSTMPLRLTAGGTVCAARRVRSTTHDTSSGIDALSPQKKAGHPRGMPGV